MPANFHTHTFRCKHASGSPRDYFKIAATQGCDALGFSDHCPYPQDGYDTWDFSRMECAELPYYVQDVRELAQESPFPIYLGFECEWEPRYESWFRDVLVGEHGADFLVYGAHWLREGREALYAPELRSVAEIRRYFTSVIAGIQSGLFAFLAHPDLIMANGMAWNKELEAGFTDVIDAAKSYNMPIEINGYGMIKERIRSYPPCARTKTGERLQYPVDEFWQLAVKRNAIVICNSDAHSPDYVMQGVINAREYAVQFGITPIDNIFI
jgi:histidinol-phosphatase (PHP family)